MYKVYFQEKLITIGDAPNPEVKNLRFEQPSIVKVALDLLKNSSKNHVHLYHHHVDAIWETFKETFKYIQAAGGMIENTEGNFLFIYRHHKWDLPKGKLEKGEAIEEAAIREANEEVGLDDLFLKDFITSTFHIYRENGDDILKETFWYHIEYKGNEEPTPQTEEGIQKTVWLSLAPNSSDKQMILDNTFENIKLVLQTKDKTIV